METPLLIFKDGRFTPAEPVPEWYARLPNYSDDWDAEYEKVGLKAVRPVDMLLDGYEVAVYVRDDHVYYAELWVDGLMLWCATFAPEEWPLFLAQFVLPLEHVQKLLFRVDEIHQEVVEYLVRNEPDNPEAARRRREWEQAQERRRENRKQQGSAPAHHAALRRAA